MSTSNYLILIGPPNSGKSTLFNWITGYKRQVVNYPGSTVDLSIGIIQNKHTDPAWKIVDTPGVYHLPALKDPPSKKHLYIKPAEEQVLQQILRDTIGKSELRGVVLTLDSTRLARQLPLVFYLKATKMPFILALSMYDLQKKQTPINIALLSKWLKIPICPIEGLLGGGVKELLQTAQTYFKKSISKQDLSLDTATWSETTQEILLKKSQDIINKVQTKNASDKQNSITNKTKKIDAWLLHPLFGFFFLIGILFIFFSSIFWLAAPLMNLTDSGFTYLVHYVSNINNINPIIHFLANGMLTSFGAFFVFVPQVFILFVGIHFLDQSGYLARAVSLVDGPFSRIGLSGKSLIPFLSGFACAIPAVLSTRNISSKKEKWISIFVIPLMTCSARLPVYVLLLSFLFYGKAAWMPGLLMAFLYFLSLALGIVTAGILNAFFKSNEKSNFLIDLPLYRRPILSNLLAISWSRTKYFILKAGPVIFLFALLMWGAMHLPYRPHLSPKAQIQQSYAGQFGKWIEPAVEKIGGDWRVGISLLSAFVAREVFVSVLAVMLQNTTEDTNKITQVNQSVASNTSSDSLIATMRSARRLDGKPLFSFASVMALLMFFMLSLQCLSTTGIVYKETGSWKLAGLQLAILNGLAYISAMLIFQLLS